MVYQISKWAKNNTRKARLILLLLHLVFIADAFIFGQILSEKNVIFPEETIIISLTVFLTAFFIYPVKSKSGKFIKNSKLFPYSFKKHKITDFIIVLCSFILVLTVSNRISLSNTVHLRLISESYAADFKDNTVNENSPEKKIFIKSLPDNNESPVEFREKKDNIFKKILFKNNEFNWALMGFILLVVLLGLIASLGVSMLACNIYCGGSEIVGWIILVSGESLIAFLGVWAIKRFLRRQEKNKISEEVID
jgi:hypothetical protein